MSKSQEHLIEQRNRQLDQQGQERAHTPHRAARQSEMPVSLRGMNQESSQNKHNRPAKGAPKH
jgi:hypothetical protein